MPMLVQMRAERENPVLKSSTRKRRWTNEPARKSWRTKQTDAPLSILNVCPIHEPGVLMTPSAAGQHLNFKQMSPPATLKATHAKRHVTTRKTKHNASPVQCEPEDGPESDSTRAPSNEQTLGEQRTAHSRSSATWDNPNTR